MESTSKILDAFHAMNVVLQKDPNASEGEAELLRYTADERAQLCARISHLFQGRCHPFLKRILLIKNSTSKFNET